MGPNVAARVSKLWGSAGSEMSSLQSMDEILNVVAALPRILKYAGEQQALEWIAED